MGDLNRYEYADVGLYRDRRWVKGTLKVERPDKTAGFVLSFTPSENVNASHAIEAPVNILTDVDRGDSNGESYFKLSVPIAGRNRPKKCVFNFGNRASATATLLGVVTQKPKTPPVSQPTRRTDNSQASASSAADRMDLTRDDDSKRDADGYFAKYGVPGKSKPTSGELEPGGPTPAARQARKVMLELDDELQELYTNVVLTGIIDEEEFWNARQAQLDEETASLSQQRGLSSGLTADVHASRTDQDSVRYELTKEQLQRILIDQPKVNAIYKVKVPQELSEVEFWKLYLSSRFFPPNHNLGPEFRQSEQALAAAKVFGSFDDDDDDDLFDTQGRRITSIENRASRPKGIHVDPNVDLLRTLNDDPHGSETALAGVGMAHRAGFGVVQRDVLEERKDKENREKLRKLGRKATLQVVKKLEARPLESAPIIARYNRHGSLVLPDEEAHPDRVQKRIQRVIEMERDAEVFHDLEEAGGIRLHPDPIPLELQGTSAYVAVGGKKAKTGAQGKPVLVQRPTHGGLYNWSPDRLDKVFPSSRVAMQVIDHVVQEARIGLNDQPQSLETIPDHEELLRIFRISNELRRHFWGSFPPALRPKEPLETQSSFVRLQGIVDKLKQCHGRTRDFRTYARNRGNTPLSNLLLDLMEQMEKAISDFDRFREFQRKKRQR